MKDLFAGLITGIIFGFLLQKSKVIRYNQQIGALRFLDMTIIKFMLSSIIVGMIGIYLLKDLNVISLNIKSANIGANIIGGLLFGLGWGILGYCPGTQLGAVGEGRLDAVWGILGAILGAGLFAELNPFLKKIILTWGDFGKITIPDILNVNHWIIIPIFIFLCLMLFIFFEKKRI